MLRSMAASVVTVPAVPISVSGPGSPNRKNNPVQLLPNMELKIFIFFCINRMLGNEAFGEAYHAERRPGGCQHLLVLAKNKLGASAADVKDECFCLTKAVSRTRLRLLTGLLLPKGSLVHPVLFFPVRDAQTLPDWTPPGRHWWRPPGLVYLRIFWH